MFLFFRMLAPRIRCCLELQAHVHTHRSRTADMDVEHVIRNADVELVEARGRGRVFTMFMLT